MKMLLLQQVLQVVLFEVLQMLSVAMLVNSRRLRKKKKLLENFKKMHKKMPLVLRRTSIVSMSQSKEKMRILQLSL